MHCVPILDHTFDCRILTHWTDPSAVLESYSANG
jgi:hypothetical protein